MNPESLGDWLSQAMSGPGKFRFLIQPVLALLLGLRDGRKDARAGKPPYLRSLFRSKASRRERLKAGFAAAKVPLTLAVLLDLFLQWLVMRRLNIGWSVVVGLLLIALPYSLARGLGNRGTRWRARSHGEEKR